MKSDWSILFKSKNWTGWKTLMTVYDRTEKEAKEAAENGLFYYCGTYDWMVVPSYKKLTKPNASDIIQNMKNTLTYTEKITKSATEIVNLIEDLGFVTDTPVLDLELQIGYILQRNLQMDNFINPAADRVTIADKITISKSDLDSWNRDEMGG